MQNITFWLDYIQKLHPLNIDYSLERIKTVAERLGVLKPTIPVITVAGTNGKGSTVAAMEAILLAAGYRVGTFTSPYLEYFNEQIRLNEQPVSDEILIHAFKEIDQVRGDISLSEFEFTTLAALLIFKHAALDIMVLEVGLGGGNDAVNIMNPDVTVITSIAFDHEEYLGHTLDEIAAAEAKLLRSNKVAVIGAKNPPEVLLRTAQQLNCEFVQVKREAASAFEHNSQIAVQALQHCPLISITAKQIQTGLQQVKIKGRQERIANWLIDVAHNPEAILELVKSLNKETQTLAVFSMFKDKKIAEIIKALSPFVSLWSIAVIDHARGASLEQLLQGFRENGISEDKIKVNANLREACQTAASLAKSQDLILACGSFYAARAALAFLSSSIPVKKPQSA